MKTSFKLFLNNVFPVDTISQTASDKPMFGAISTDPLILCISQFNLFLSKNPKGFLGMRLQF